MENFLPVSGMSVFLIQTLNLDVLCDQYYIWDEVTGAVGHESRGPQQGLRLTSSTKVPNKIALPKLC